MGVSCSPPFDQEMFRPSHQRIVSTGGNSHHPNPDASVTASQKRAARKGIVPPKSDLLERGGVHENRNERPSLVLSALEEPDGRTS